MSFHNDGAEMDKKVYREFLEISKSSFQHMWLQRVESVTLLMSLLQKEERKV